MQCTHKSVDQTASKLFHKTKMLHFCEYENFDAQTCNEASQLYSRVFPSKFTRCLYKLGQLFRDIKTSL